MRRKYLWALIIALLLIPTLVLAYTPYVLDTADTLLDDELRTLEGMAKTVSEAGECGVYILTVNDTGESDVFTYATQAYDELQRGYGDGRDGVMLVLSMAERDYALIAYGDFGNAAFTDYGKDALSEEFLDNFAADDWYGGFYDYIAESEKLISQARSGKPVDIYASGAPEAAAAAQAETEYVQERGFFPTLLDNMLAALPIAAVAALVICFIMWRCSRSAVKGGSANEYLIRDSISITKKADRFTHSTQTRTLIESSSSSSSGGGTKVNSQGFSGKSGKF